MRNESPRKTAGKGALESIVWAMSASRSHSVSFGVVWNQLIDISRYIASNHVRCAIVILCDSYCMTHTVWLILYDSYKILLCFQHKETDKALRLVSDFTDRYRKLSSAACPKFSDRNKCFSSSRIIFQRKKKRNVESVIWSNRRLWVDAGWKKFSLAFIYLNYVRMSWNLI